MCGIIAILNKKNVCIEYLINGLKQLQNRGYDSAGICTLSDNLDVIKYASNNIDSIKALEKNKNLIKDSNIGIAHTRWATHGVKTDYNSHPHLSNNKEIAVVHNGIIENYSELKDMLIKKNYKFKSETDTEVISNLLEYNLSQTTNFLDTIKKTISMLSGTYGLAILNLKEQNKIYAVRHGSPLLIGQTENMVMITSEQSGFNGLVNNYFILDSDDICKVILNDNIQVNTSKKYSLKETLNLNFDLDPSPFPHWTIKEINEQYDASLRAISLGGRLLNENKVKLGGIDENIEILKRLDNLIFLGCGTSLNACNYGLNHFKDLCSFNTLNVYDGAEFNIDDIPKIGNTAIILLSQSGETIDLYRCLKIGKENDLFIISIVNVVDSLIARESDCGCYLNAGREVGVASTKSFLNQCILLSMLAIWFSQIHNKNNNKRKVYIECLRKLPYDIKKTIEIGIENKKLYLDILNKNNMFILGKNQAESIVVIISPENNNYAKNCNAYEEISSRNAPILFITDKKECNFKNNIILPKNKVYANLISIIPIQFAAYYLSVKRGLNPDKPRNLAKCVTVE